MIRPALALVLVAIPAVIAAICFLLLLFATPATAGGLCSKGHDCTATLEPDASDAAAAAYDAVLEIKAGPMTEPKLQVEPLMLTVRPEMLQVATPHVQDEDDALVPLALIGTGAGLCALFCEGSRPPRALPPVSPPTVNPVPEPGSWLLMLMGFGALGGVLRRSRKAPRHA